MKFKTKARVVEAFRISDASVGTVGNWVVLDGTEQTIVTNEEFIARYNPAGRGASKTTYESAKAELAT
jgi:hypothetical protein